MDRLPGIKAVFCCAATAPDTFDALLRFRKGLFVDLLGWDLRVNGDREEDEFDTETAFYCALYSGQNIVAGFRAIRTDFPYLAREVFPDLARTHPFPSRRDIWEISRFGVMPGPQRIQLARINYALMFRFALLRGATALVAVADPTHERILRSFGIRSARYGPPQFLARLGSGKPIAVVAGEIRLGDQQDRRFQALLDETRQVEIKDETLVLGRSRISA